MKKFQIFFVFLIVIGLIFLLKFKSRNSNINFSCFKDTDCVVGIQVATCCSCPKVINKSLIGTENWQIYITGKDYSNQKPKYCDAVNCQPCSQSAEKPQCLNGQCQSY